MLRLSNAAVHKAHELAGMSAIGKRRLLKAKNRGKTAGPSRTMEWWRDYYMSSPRYAKPLKMGDMGWSMT